MLTTDYDQLHLFVKILWSKYTCAANNAVDLPLFQTLSQHGSLEKQYFKTRCRAKQLTNAVVKTLFTQVLLVGSTAQHTDSNLFNKLVFVRKACVARALTAYLLNIISYYD